MEICTSLADYFSVLTHLLHLIWGRVLAIFPSDGALRHQKLFPKTDKIQNCSPSFWGAKGEIYTPEIEGLLYDNRFLDRS